jgi:nucleotide-binding universal stress UspA family protein
MYRKILVAYDGSDGAKRALAAAIDVARRYGAELHSIAVVEKLPHFAATVGEVKEALRELTTRYEWISQEAAREAKGHGIELHTKVQPGHEVEAVVDYAREGKFDLLVIGFSGHSHAFGRVMGGTAQNLTRLAPCAVLVAK